ncbi:hypothetical protein D3C87_1823430 [compost metagenome]
MSHLVKVSDLQIGALADRAAVGLQLPKDHFQQCRFASAVGADQPDFVAAQDGAGEVVDDGFVAK